MTLSAGTAPSGPPGTRRRQLGLLWEALQLKRGPPMTAVTPSVSAVACHRTSNAEPFISSRAYGRRPATLEREWEMWNKLQSHRDGSGAGDRSPKRPRKYARRLVRMLNGFSSVVCHRAREVPTCARACLSPCALWPRCADLAIVDVFRAKPTLRQDPRRALDTFVSDPAVGPAAARLQSCRCGEKRRATSANTAQSREDAWRASSALRASASSYRNHGR